jgi:hypothetical protein
MFQPAESVCSSFLGTATFVVVAKTGMILVVGAIVAARIVAVDPLGVEGRVVVAAVAALIGVMVRVELEEPGVAGTGVPAVLLVVMLMPVLVVLVETVSLEFAVVGVVAVGATLVTRVGVVVRVELEVRGVAGTGVPAVLLVVTLTPVLVVLVETVSLEFAVVGVVAVEKKLVGATLVARVGVMVRVELEVPGVAGTGVPAVLLVVMRTPVLVVLVETASLEVVVVGVVAVEKKLVGATLVARVGVVVCVELEGFVLNGVVVVFWVVLLVAMLVLLVETVLERVLGLTVVVAVVVVVKVESVDTETLRWQTPGYLVASAWLASVTTRLWFSKRISL